MEQQTLKNAATDCRSDVAMRIVPFTPGSVDAYTTLRQSRGLYQSPDEAQQLLMLRSTFAPRQEFPELEIFYASTGGSIGRVQDGNSVSVTNKVPAIPVRAAIQLPHGGRMR
jgi:hypothetical protein